MKPLFTMLLFFFLIDCSDNSNQDENCRFLLNIGVNVVVNLNLPQFNQLQFAGNSVYIPNAGNSGIIVASTGTDFFAWDAADPNQIPSSCSILVNSGLNAVSSCDDKNEYNLINGLPLKNSSLRCGLKNYRVNRNGNTLIISN